MTGRVVIDGWTCHAIETRAASRKSAIGESFAWLTPNGCLETEYRPDDPDDDNRDVKVPAAVLRWLVMPMLHEAWDEGYRGGDSPDNNPHVEQKGTTP